MHEFSVCGVNTNDCQKCPKAVDNTIVYASHSRGFHLPVQQCEENIMIFLLRGEVLVNSQEYAGTTLRAGEFILQAIGSKYEILALTDVECVCYRFTKPEFFCEGRYNYIAKEVAPPLIFFPLKISAELQFFLGASKSYLTDAKICKELLSFKQKELSFILSHCYTDYELSMLVHPLSKYTDSFQYFVLKNHLKMKTVIALLLFVVYSLPSSISLSMSGCWNVAKKVLFTTSSRRMLPFPKFVLNTDLSLCLISLTSVRRTSEFLLVICVLSDTSV